MNKNVECKFVGIKCDNPACDWIDDSVQQSEYESWINRQCPKCGENLLTLEDYNNAMLVIRVADILNLLSEDEIDEINKSMGFDNNEPKGEPKIYNVETHKGIKFTEVEPPKD